MVRFWLDWVHMAVYRVSFSFCPSFGPCELTAVRLDYLSRSHPLFSQFDDLTLSSILHGGGALFKCGLADRQEAR